MNATSTRLSALLAVPSHAISTTRDHTEVASFEKVEVRPFADTMEPASPHERFEATSVTRVSTKAVQPGVGMARSTLPGGKELRLSCMATRSEEHTSELQSPCNLVCRLLLEKKKKKQ